MCSHMASRNLAFYRAAFCLFVVSKKAFHSWPCKLANQFIEHLYPLLLNMEGISATDLITLVITNPIIGTSLVQCLMLLKL